MVERENLRFLRARYPRLPIVTLAEAPLAPPDPLAGLDARAYGPPSPLLGTVARGELGG